MKCLVCTAATDLNSRKDLLDHMQAHRNNPDLLIEKFADYVAEHELG